MSDDDGPPPLEDLSEYVNKMTGNKVHYDKVKVSQSTPETKELPTQQNKDSGNTTNKLNLALNTEPSKKSSNSNMGYAGMRKGFLSSGLSNPRKRGQRKEIKITEVKSNPQAKLDGLKLDEVQAKMTEANQFLSENSNEWLSDDLLKRIQSNNKINNKLNNPQFMAAFAEFQTNPQAAARKYGDNAEMKEFIQEFSGMMGNHFTNLAEKQNAGK